MYSNNKSSNYDYTHRQIKLAIDVLVKDILTIDTVSDWAKTIGYSRAHFCRKFTNIFGENPKYVLRRARFRQVCRSIQSDWAATAYKIARDSGIKDEKALHKFLKRNFSTSFTGLKDFLKKETFRSRNYLSHASEDKLYYLFMKQSSGDISAFPANFPFKKGVKDDNNSKHMKP